MIFLCVLCCRDIERVEVDLSPEHRRQLAAVTSIISRSSMFNEDGKYLYLYVDGSFSVVNELLISCMLCVVGKEDDADNDLSDIMSVVNSPPPAAQAEEGKYLQTDNVQVMFLSVIGNRSMCCVL